jgi:hypothetical protein
MRTALILGMAVALTALLPGAASAQERCLEGRTASGKCVKPDLAEAMRKQAIVYSQPKFSFTNAPVMPSEDGEYYVPPAFGEIRTLFGAFVPPAARP